jgi:hypothetical protein
MRYALRMPCVITSVRVTSRASARIAEDRSSYSCMRRRIQLYHVGSRRYELGTDERRLYGNPNVHRTAACVSYGAIDATAIMQFTATY